MKHAAKQAVAKPASHASEMETDFAALESHFLEKLPVRSREILSARYGFSGKKPKTLEEIGRQYGITRERVRQVVCSALEALSRAIEGDRKLSAAGERILSTLKSKNGIMTEDDLIAALSENKTEAGMLMAFLDAMPGIVYEKADEHHERIFRLKSVSLERWRKIKDAARAVLSEAKEVLSGRTLYTRAAKALDVEVAEEEFFDALRAAKEIKQNVYKKWGLSQWSEVRPRGTREKAYLVLKTAGKPLHFREIATLIDEHGLHGRKKRKSHPQTVHNELIKDKRFVLVGRGTYALSEWGYKRGTVKDVITEILKKAKRPMTKDEILEEVLKVRQVKKSTVIINLNSFFERVGRSTYALKG